MSKCLQCDGRGVVRVLTASVICGCMLQTVRQNSAVPTSVPEKLPGIKSDEDDREALCGCHLDPRYGLIDAARGRDAVIMCAWHLRHLG